jgi:hypothetical protein
VFLHACSDPPHQFGPLVVGSRQFVSLPFRSEQSLDLTAAAPDLSVHRIRRLPRHSNIFFFRPSSSITFRPAPRKQPRSPATVVIDGGPMATPIQIQAHRSNAQLPTGARTEPGELERRQTRRQALRSAGDPAVTDSSETENPEIGFVPQLRLQAPKSASFRKPPRGPRRCQPSPPRYTVISDSNSPTRPWLK